MGGIPCRSRTRRPPGAHMNVYAKVPERGSLRDFPYAEPPVGFEPTTPALQARWGDHGRDLWDADLGEMASKTGRASAVRRAWVVDGIGEGELYRVLANRPFPGEARPPARPESDGLSRQAVCADLTDHQECCRGPHRDTISTGRSRLEP